MPRLTDDEVIDMMRSGTPLAQARAKFAHWYATIEQKEAQSKPPSILEIRRLEFEAVEEIWKLKP